MNRAFAIVTMALICLTPVVVVVTMKIVGPSEANRSVMTPNSALLLPSDLDGPTLPVAYA